MSTFKTFKFVLSLLSGIETLGCLFSIKSLSSVLSLLSGIETRDFEVFNFELYDFVLSPLSGIETQTEEECLFR